MTRLAWIPVWLVSLLLSAPAGARLVLQVSRIASGLDAPVLVTAPSGDMSRLFVVEQNNARILILDRTSGVIRATPFLTVPGVATGGEQGLLGMAFDPAYATNGYFYVNFTATPDGRTAVVRYQVSADPDVADADSATPVLSFSQPQANHNGGWLGFGPDGYLYVATGDGGAGDDQGDGHTEPGGNAQDLTGNLLGKLLRIDVSGDDFPADPGRNYSIPPSNPFVGQSGDDEIWAYGLRNPWRASFDRLTGDLYVGDVGQNATEEIDVQPASSGGGENYGWRLREGTHETPGGVGGSPPANGVNPIYEYGHGSGSLQGFAVTGGYVYRGPIADLQGRYFFADFSNSRLWTLRFDGSAVGSFDGGNYTDLVDLTDSVIADAGSIDLISAFGEDSAGNLFVVDYGGEIFEIRDAISSFGSIDVFKTYRVKAADDAPGFAPFGPIHLTDRFGSLDVDVTRWSSLATPADMNGEGVTDPTTHLDEYRVSSTAAAIGVQVRVANACNGLTIEVGKPTSLLVPSHLSASGPPAVPDAGIHEVDHFLCYKARSLTRLPRGMQVDLVDEFDGAATRRYDLRKVTRLCTPVDKSGSPVVLGGPDEGDLKPITPATRKHAEQRLLCYGAKLARNSILQAGCGPAFPGGRGTRIEPPQPRHAAALGWHSNDQFGPRQLDTTKELEVCLPSIEVP